MTDTFEIAFSFDTTSSMYKCLEEVRKRLKEMVQDLRNKIPGIKIAIIAHGDYCDKAKYVTKYINFSNDPTVLFDFVNTVSGTGGGDFPECYELVMREVQEKLIWSKYSQKALVLIGDAVPHEPDEDQNVRHLDWKVETRRLRDMEIKIYSVQCLGRLESTNFYQYIAAKTFGYYMPLTEFSGVKELLTSGLEETLSSDHTFGTTSTVFIPLDDRPHLAIEEAIDTHVSDGEYDDDEDDEEDESYVMRCFICKKSKPSSEFPNTPISSKCKHYPGHCLRCVVEYVRENGRCPHEGCDVDVDHHGEMIQIYEAKLDRMFVDYSKVIAETRTSITRHEGPTLSVSAINGDTAWVPFNPRMTIIELKREVESQLGIQQSKQKLIFKGKAIKTNIGPGLLLKLSDLGITENSSLSLIVPLYCIPASLDHVVFDLSWEFPKTNPDFLDASCLAFEKAEFIQVIDWNHSSNDYYLKGAIQHSAKNVKTAGGRIGHQTIHVHLKGVPSNITHLYFTLSSWKAPNLSAFTNPSLQFYEASDPGTNLCSTTISHALNSQAVVVCYVVRAGTQWQIFECDVSGCVDGNTKKYNPIRERIAHLIENECFDDLCYKF